MNEGRITQMFQNEDPDRIKKAEARNKLEQKEKALEDLGSFVSGALDKGVTAESIRDEIEEIFSRYEDKKDMAA